MDHKIKPSLEPTERKQLVVLLFMSLKVFSTLTPVLKMEVGCSLGSGD